MRGFAASVGYDGAPFIWNEARRFLLRCELDALYFGLYLGFGAWRPATEAEESPEDRAKLTEYFPTPIDALDHVMASFPIVRRKELANEELVARANATLQRHGVTLEDRYPSHAVIRAMYLEMCDAAIRRTNWKSWLED